MPGAFTRTEIALWGDDAFCHKSAGKLDAAVRAYTVGRRAMEMVPDGRSLFRKRVFPGWNDFQRRQ
jgi:hypothetical protein